MTVPGGGIERRNQNHGTSGIPPTAIKTGGRLFSGGLAIRTPELNYIANASKEPILVRILLFNSPHWNPLFKASVLLIIGALPVIFFLEKQSDLIK